MTNIDKRPRRRFVLMPILGALAVVAAGAVLYGTVAPAGKAASECPADSAKLAARLAPLAKGELAALQVTSEPRRAEQFAFERDGGGKLTVADFKGRPILLNLWATWCAPCRAEMPTLDKLQAARRGWRSEARSWTALAPRRWFVMPIRAATRSRPCARRGGRLDCR